jgi:single-strand DNA-binding protein
MLNLVTMAGHLIRDSELKYTKEGKAVLNFDIANNNKYNNNENVVYIKCELWGSRADSLNQYLRKGCKVTVIGPLRLNQWNDQKTGEKKSKLYIYINDIILEGDKNSQNRNSNSNYNSNSPPVTDPGYDPWK